MQNDDIVRPELYCPWILNADLAIDLVMKVGDNNNDTLV